MMYRKHNPIIMFLALVIAVILLSALGPGTANAAATVTVSPTAGNPYSLVNLIGSQFVPSDSIPVGGITFAGNSWNTEVIQIDVAGNWNVSLRIPANASIGGNIVGVSTTGGTVAITTFTVMAPPVTLYPSTGPRYALLTLTGSSFVPLDTIPVGGIKFAGTLWNTEQVSIDGSGRWTTSLRVPTNAAMGANTVSVLTNAGTTATATFTVTAPPITVSPNSGPRYIMVTVSGLNFVPLDTIPVSGIKLGSVSLNTAVIPIDASGSWTTSLRVPPAAASGADTVTVTTSGGTVATGSFTVTVPPITLSLSSGYPYTLVTLAGSQFGPLDTIAVGGVTFAGASWNTSAIQIDNCGNWNTMLRVPPNAVVGSNTVRVITTGGSIVTATFTVTAPPVSVSPGSGSRYTSVTISGSNFVPLDTIPVGGIKLDGAPWNTVAIPIDDSGRWSTNLRVPVNAVCCGSKTVLVTTAAGTMGTTTFTVTAPPITLSPSNGPRYTQVTITGSNFVPLDKIPVCGIKFGNKLWNPMEIPIDDAGTWTASLRVPTDAAIGANTITVTTSGGSVTTATFTVTVPPVGLSPASGPRYTLVIVSGSNFVPQDRIPVGSITFGGRVWNEGEIVVNDSGAWSTSLRVPTDAAVGANSVIVTTNGGTVSAATFTVSIPPITLSPSTGTFNILVTIRSSGFVPEDTIPAGGITFNGASWNTDIVQVDVCGSWSTSLKVPANAVIGPNTVMVVASGGTETTATFTVTAPPITVSPGIGPPYTLVTITGSNFVPQDSIPVGGIKFNGSPWNTTTIPIDETGRWSINIRVPITAPCCGSKPILVITTAGTVAASTFTITAPVVTLTPSQGPIGTKITVCVRNMTPDNQVPVGGITFGGVPMNTTATDIDGTGSMCTVFLTIPVSTVGAHAVVVNDGHLLATSNFTITQPTISISPVSGYKGDKVKVSGSSWPQKTPGSVSITFAGSPVGIATPDTNGAFSFEFTVPLTAEASNLIGASDILSNTALPRTFSLKAPTLTLNPTNGLPGSSATVTGAGFQPYSALEELKFGNANILSSPAITNEVGTFTATFTVPGLPPGGYTVIAKVAGVTLSACYTINESNIIPTPVEPAFQIGPYLASIADKLIIAWGYSGGEWKMYDPNDALGSTLTGMSSGSGYWIKVSDNCALYSRQLTKGWNLIGW